MANTVYESLSKTNQFNSSLMFRVNSKAKPIGQNGNFFLMNVKHFLFIGSHVRCLAIQSNK